MKYDFIILNRFILIKNKTDQNGLRNSKKREEMEFEQLFY